MRISAKSSSWLTPLQQLFGLPPPQTHLEIALLATSTLALFAAFLQSYVDVCTYGGVDLRPKVVGARCLWTGRDPYTYQWQADEPETLLDPHKRHPGVNRVSYPPTLLLLYSPCAWLPYQTQRLLWYVVEWTALLASMALLSRLVGRSRRLLFVVLALWFFAAGNFWRLHVERGQYYVFVLLALAAGLFLALARRHRGWLPGLLIGLGVAMRPTMVLLLIVLLVAGRFRLAVSGALGALIFVLLTLPLGGVALWFSYADLVVAQGKMVGDLHYVQEKYGPEVPVPAVVEGVEVRAALPDDSANTTLAAVYRGFILKSAQQTSMDINGVANVCLLALAVAGLAWMAATRRRNPSLRYACSVAVVLPLLSEFFVPIRIGYADVFYLLPLALLLRGMFRGLMPGGAALALLLGLTEGQLDLFGSFFATWARSLLLMGAFTSGIVRSGWRGSTDAPRHDLGA